jgi:transposase
MDLSSEQMAELRELAGSRDVPAVVALRARVVLWSAEGRRRKDIAELAGVAPLTVDRCKARYAERGVAGLEDKRRGGPRTQVPPRVRARVIALTRMSPPADSGLSHWSTRSLADHLKRREGISVSWHYVARIWREENLKLHRSGTFKISKDPAFVEKVADIVGLYLGPARWCRGAVDRREDAGAGPGPDSAGTAGGLRGHREAHPRLRPTRHHEPVRRAERRDR